MITNQRYTDWRAVDSTKKEQTQFDATVWTPYQGKKTNLFARFQGESAA